MVVLHLLQAKDRRKNLMMTNDLVVVYTTASNSEDAQMLATHAIERRLAACVQIEAIQSVYRWKGEVQSEPEQRVLFKTTIALYPQLESMITELHPYELPAIFATPVVAASSAYAARVREAVG
jgi:periplasmic divalent cation tolerance protein